MNLSPRSTKTNNWSADKFKARLYLAIQSCDTDSRQSTITWISMRMCAIKLNIFYMPYTPVDVTSIQNRSYFFAFFRRVLSERGTRDTRDGGRRVSRSTPTLCSSEIREKTGPVLQGKRSLFLEGVVNYLPFRKKTSGKFILVTCFITSE